MNPKSFVAVALAGAALASALLAPPSSSGQAGVAPAPSVLPAAAPTAAAAAADDPALTSLLNEVTAQQATLAENQAKIDAKLATISENLRQARIYVGRGGGKVP